jgi:hypothetical protein
MTCSASVFGEEHRRGGQGGLPAVLPDRVEELVEQADVAALPLGVAAVLGVQIGQIAFQHRPVDPGQILDPDGDQEAGETSGSHDAPANGFVGQAAAEPPAGPPLGEFA